MNMPAIQMSCSQSCLSGFVLVPHCCRYEKYRLWWAVARGTAFKLCIQTMASSPFRLTMDSNRKAGPPGRLTPRSHSDTRFLDTLR